MSKTKLNQKLENASRIRTKICEQNIHHEYYLLPGKGGTSSSLVFKALSALLLQQLSSFQLAYNKIY